MVSRKSLVNAYPAKKGGAGVPQVDSSSDGTVSPRQPPLISSPLPQPPTPQLAGQGRLLEEKNDRISKEKQKFFRLSAFNAEHSKLKRVGGGDNKSRPSRSVVGGGRSTTRGDAANVSPAKGQIVGSTSRLSGSSSSSSGSGSSSSGNSSSSSSEAGGNSSESSEDGSDSSDEDDDEDDDEAGNSSSESSSDSSSSDDETTQDGRLESPPKVPFACDPNEDKLWGFAAAAAKLKVAESPFFSGITSTFGPSLPKLDVGETPTFGLHIQEPAVAAAAAATTVTSSDNKKKDKSERNNSAQQPAGYVNKVNRVKPGAGQLRSLFDGLSHFFSASTNSRARLAGAQAPNYAPDRRKRHSNNAVETVGKSTTSKVARSSQKSKAAENESPGPSKSASKKPTTNERKKTEVVGTGEVVTRLPKPGIFVPSDESVFERSFGNERMPKMTPSGLVKTAVNSKRHEHERRRLMMREADASSLVKCADVTASSPSSSSPSSRHEQQQQQQQQSRKKHTQAADNTQIRHPVPVVRSSGLGSDSVKSNPNLKSHSRNSAITTNTTTVPRATPCSTMKGKSLPHPRSRSP